MEVISQHDIQNEARIDIKIDPYDEKTARFHLKKVQEFMSNPYAFQNIFGSNNYFKFNNHVRHFKSCQGSSDPC